VNGFRGPSRDELVSQVSGIPVMGGVTGGKKIIASGIPVMGGVTGIKKSGSSGKLIVERNVERKIVGRAAGNPTKCIEGLALREAPHVSHRTYADVASGLAQAPVIGTSVPPLAKLGSLGIRMPAGLKSVEEVAPEWEEIEMAVDSGASESVVSEDMLQGVETVEGYAKKKGVQYEVADGTLIPNLGEKKYVAVSDAGVARHMKSQVCEVNKALLSVHRCVQAGNKVVFAASGSYIEDETSGETMPLTEKGGMYMLRLWVKAQGFGGPAGEQ